MSQVSNPPQSTQPAPDAASDKVDIARREWELKKDQMNFILRSFLPDRICYAVINIGAVVLMVVCAIQLKAPSDTDKWSRIAGLGGSSGIIAVVLGRVLIIFNKAWEEVFGGHSTSKPN